MKKSSFPYSYWTKFLGLLVIIAGVVSFFLQYQKKGIFDFNELAVGLSWGLFLSSFPEKEQMTK
jgi:hypothetical protein